MKASHIASILLCLAVCISCRHNSPDTKEKEIKVRIETSIGELEVKLYNETPIHRDNFLKLVRDGVYDNVLFHRIIRDFMVQAGDPAQRTEEATAAVDTNKFRYTLPAEIVYPRYYHKKGALAAARMGDDVNPLRESSGTQFYIVTGKVFTTDQLSELKTAVYQSKVDACYESLCQEHAEEMNRMSRRKDTETLQALRDSLLYEAESRIAANPPAPFTDIQKKTYTTVGGAPHLDGEYTVFGEVTDGMAVVEALEKVRTDEKDHPVREVFIRKMTVIDDK
ncbi:MAG: peptidylprolyl isomerase [Paraprevotella sp.]|nr:peptidylprolyl isomerase [Paraprevotella sp.]